MRPFRQRLLPAVFILLLLACWTLGAVPAAPRLEEGETPVETASPTPEASATFTETPSPTPTATATPLPVFAAAENLGEGYLLDELVVGLIPGATPDTILSCLAAVGGTIASQIEELNALVVRVPSGTVANAITGLRLCPGVDYAEPNYLVYVADVYPNDASWGSQYALPMIRAPQGWEYTTGSAAVIIAIVDTGIDLDHPDLAGKLVPGQNIINPSLAPDDGHGHGTHVAGIAAASSNNLTGVAGTSWGARLMPVKALNNSGFGTFANLASGITWATDNGAHIINLSVGSVNPSSLVEAAVNYAYANGVVVVAAAGNTTAGCAPGQILFPGRYDHVIAVSATDAGYNLASFSCYGPQVDLAAPGDDIYSTSAFGGYLNRDGTSQAAAFVSGLAAILRGLPGSGSVDNIEWLMRSTALDLGPAGADSMFGSGLIQMDAALRIFFPTAVPPTATGAFYYPPASSRTPTRTASLSPTRTETGATPSASPSPTATATVPSSAGQPPIGGGGAEPGPSPTPERGAPPRVEYPLLFCYGIGLLLIGALILFLALRRKKRPSSLR